MARTKPTDARDKILRAERIRLRQCTLDPEFQRDLTELESVAKRLATTSPGLMPVSKLTEADLLPTADETAFRELAERFKENWNFQPRLTDDGKVELSIPSPISAKGTVGKTAWTVVDDDTRRFSAGEVTALLEHSRSARQRAREINERVRAYVQEHKCDYPTARKTLGVEWTEHRTGTTALIKPPPQRRRRLDTDRQRLRARELAAQGKTIQQIARALFPAEYRAALKRDASAEKKLRPLAAKYIEPPHNLTWPEAEKRAASDLGLDTRPPSVKLQKLTNRVRYLLKL
jgi:hypothetical protein